MPKIKGKVYINFTFYILYITCAILFVLPYYVLYIILKLVRAKMIELLWFIYTKLSKKPSGDIIRLWVNIIIGHSTIGIYSFKLVI